MRAVVQRVSRARVVVDVQTIGEIGRGLLVLVGVAVEDTEADAAWLAEKIAGLRILQDAAGKMNLSLAEVAGSMLVVSQFTLLADCRKGRRPSFVGAAPPERGEALYNRFVLAARGQGVHVQTGRFGAYMQVELVNDGPVTLIVDSRGAS